MKIGMMLVMIGLAMEVVDAFTAKSGDSGILYGAGGILSGINDKIPGQMNIGLLLAASGAVYYKVKG